MYSRTQNENGTFNTRCLYCFMTVASAVESCAELDAVEGQHPCPVRSGGAGNVYVRGVAAAVIPAGVVNRYAMESLHGPFPASAAVPLAPGAARGAAGPRVVAPPVGAPTSADVRW